MFVHGIGTIATDVGGACSAPDEMVTVRASEFMTVGSEESSRSPIAVGGRPFLLLKHLTAPMVGHPLLHFAQPVANETAVELIPR
jgi:hypothetical protein